VPFVVCADGSERERSGGDDVVKGAGLVVSGKVGGRCR
jgi:hypothetical protein